MITLEGGIEGGNGKTVNTLKTKYKYEKNLDYDKIYKEGIRCLQFHMNFQMMVIAI